MAGVGAGRVGGHRPNGSRPVGRRAAGSSGSATLASHDHRPGSRPGAARPPAARPRIFSGIQPSGIVHLGNDLGAIRNYVALQWEYEAIYCIVDYHALTSTHDPDLLRTRTREMAAVAAGPRPRPGALHAVRPEPPARAHRAGLAAHHGHAGELAGADADLQGEEARNQPDDINHGLLTYPVLQAADIVIYKASLVPVGKDQAAHLELSREIVRAFNTRYGETFPEPQAVFTEAPIVLGTDGVRKMSKSVGNTIDMLASRRSSASRSCRWSPTPADPADRPGPAGGLQRLPAAPLFGDDYEEIWEGERTARTGCVDTKRLLAERIVAHYAPARERYAN